MKSMACGVLVFCTFTANAYFADREKQGNLMHYGNIDTEIVEEFEHPNKIVPGISFRKEVRIKNSGESDCYVRMKVLFSNSDMEEKCSIDFNTTDYEYQEDDQFYYYKSVLKSGEYTKNLMEMVTIQDDVSMEELDGFSILIYQETYQTEGKINGTWRNFKDYKEAWMEFEKNKK